MKRLKLLFADSLLFLLIFSTLFISTPGNILNVNQYLRKLIGFPNSSAASEEIYTQARPAEGEQRIAITFVNGIYHSLEECQNLSTILEQSFGVKVYPFYNPSTGSWVKDFSRAGFDLVLRSSDIVLAKNLTDHFRKVFKTLGPKGRILHLAHSGGAILTYLAAKHHLTIGEANRIDVITFGGGKSITRKYFKAGRVRNYYARNDPLALIDRRTSVLLRLYEDYYCLENETYGLMQDLKHNTTFVFLEGRANHPLVDHSMFGPTYRYAIELEAQYLQQTLQELLRQEQKEKDLFRKFRKHAANLTGYHHFWEWRLVERYYYNSTYDQLHPPWRSMMRITRKQVANFTQLHGFFSGKYRQLPLYPQATVDQANETIVGNTSSEFSPVTVIINETALLSSLEKVSSAIAVGNNTTVDQKSTLISEPLQPPHPLLFEFLENISSLQPDQIKDSPLAVMTATEEWRNATTDWNYINFSFE